MEQINEQIELAEKEIKEAQEKIKFAQKKIKNAQEQIKVTSEGVTIAIIADSYDITRKEDTVKLNGEYINVDDIMEKIKSFIPSKYTPPKDLEFKLGGHIDNAEFCWILINMCDIENSMRTKGIARTDVFKRVAEIYKCPADQFDDTRRFYDRFHETIMHGATHPLTSEEKQHLDTIVNEFVEYTKKPWSKISSMMSEKFKRTITRQMCKNTWNKMHKNYDYSKKRKRDDDINDEQNKKQRTS